MTTKISKNEARSPDLLTKELKKGFTWTTQHSKLVLISSVVLLGLGGLYSIYLYMGDQREMQLQEKFFRAEKAYLKKKEAFEKAANVKKGEQEKPDGEKATGELEKDYGTEVADLKKVAAENPSSLAARMAALTLSEIYLKYDKNNEAQNVLNLVAKGSDLLTALVQLQLGTAQSNGKNCSAALESWRKVIQNEAAGFLHGDAHLKMGLCYESLNEQSKAEEAYLAAAVDKDSDLAKTAGRYLRQLKGNTK